MKNLRFFTALRRHRFPYSCPCCQSALSRRQLSEGFCSSCGEVLKVFKSEKESPISNRVIKELNAGVLSLTFKERRPGSIQVADLYESTQGKDLVGSGTCRPILSKYVKTVFISF